MIMREGECLSLSSETAHFEGVLSSADWTRNQEFEEPYRNQRLTCNLSVRSERYPFNKNYKARCCPLSTSQWCGNEHSLYLQEHHSSSVKLRVPDISQVEGDRKSSKPTLKFIQVTPVARHRKDRYLLQFQTWHSDSKRGDNLFICAGTKSKETQIFSTPEEDFLDVLACSQGTGCDTPVACLFSFDKHFSRLSSLRVVLFCGNTEDLQKGKSQFSWLRWTQSVSVYLYCLPSVLLPLLLFHPLCDNKLVCFHLNPDKHIEGEPCIPTGISEYDLVQNTHRKKKDLFGLLGGLSTIRTKFLHAEFSPDAGLLVVSCTATDPTWSLRNSVYILFSSITYQLITKIILPLHNQSFVTPTLSSHSSSDFSSVVCCKSYVPVFSRCGDKVGLVSSSRTGTDVQGKVSVHVYKIPMCVSLQCFCRKAIRNVIKEEDITKLKLPPILKRFLAFY